MRRGIFTLYTSDNRMPRSRTGIHHVNVRVESLALTIPAIRVRCLARPPSLYRPSPVRQRTLTLCKISLLDHPLHCGFDVRPSSSSRISLMRRAYSHFTHQTTVMPRFRTVFTCQRSSRISPSHDTRSRGQDEGRCLLIRCTSRLPTDAAAVVSGVANGPRGIHKPRNHADLWPDRLTEPRGRGNCQSRGSAHGGSILSAMTAPTALLAAWGFFCRLFVRRATTSPRGARHGRGSPDHHPQRSLPPRFPGRHTWSRWPRWPA